jgi:hypothetical protein
MDKRTNIQCKTNVTGCQNTIYLIVIILAAYIDLKTPEDGRVRPKHVDE